MGRRLFTLSSILLLMICVKSTALQDQTVVFQGILQHAWFYGPINFGKDPASDQLQESFYIQLPNTLKQQLEFWDKHEIVDREANKIDGCFIELTGPIDVHDDMLTKVGKKVRITGMIFEKYSRLHHTPVLLQVKKVEVVDEFIWQE